MKPDVRSRTLSILLASVAPAVVGCGPPSDLSVSGRGELVDRTSQALSVGALLFANGTYGTCVDRAGSWSLPLDSFAGTPTNPLLSVVKDDTGCVLTLTSLTTGVEETPLDWVENAATPSIEMTDTFQVAASSFASDAFYANARMSAVSYAADFTVAVLFSDDPDLAVTGTDTAGFIASSATATSQQVAAPDYSIAMTNIDVQTDAANIVEVATGTAQLTEGSAPGEGFMVLTSDPGTTHASIDAAYEAGTETLLSSLTTLQIPAASFDLVGADLTANAVRYVVISHTENGVRSYQVITVTFQPA